MKGFIRDNLLFSLCGLNCGLCPMHLNEYCPGCGGGEGNQSCSIARCSLSHSGVEYCYQCGEFPCEKYHGIDEYDSFITHRNQLKDLQKAGETGTEAYMEEQREKAKILELLLAGYNDGRRKTLFCIAVNLLELSELNTAMEQILEKTREKELTLKEKAALAARCLQESAGTRDVVLKLRKKP